MSHFTCLVIGDNPEEQLAPYGDFDVPRYIDSIVSDEDFSDFREWYATENVIAGITKSQAAGNAMLSDKELYKKFGGDWDGYAWRKKWVGLKGFRWVEYSTCNPKMKWDYHQLGGRWSGFFKLIPYGKGRLGVLGGERIDRNHDCDQALKEDIDFDSMITIAGIRAMRRYDRAMRFMGHLPRNRSWDSVSSQYKDIVKARKVYKNQLRCELAESNDSFRKFLNPALSVDEFLINRDEYIKNAKLSACSVFAVVKDGKWFARGEMGWWGIVSDEEDRQEWNKKINELIDDLPGDTLLSVYDCHM